MPLETFIVVSAQGAPFTLMYVIQCITILVASQVTLSPHKETSVGSFKGITSSLNAGQDLERVRSRPNKWWRSIAEFVGSPRAPMLNAYCA